MELITLHTHSDFCGHAKDSLAAMVDAAAQANVSVLGVTEHYPLPSTWEEAAYASMPANRLDEYRAAVADQRRAHPQMEILLGCELDWLGVDDERGLTSADFAEFDIVLGSVHFIDGWLCNSSRYKEGWEGADYDALWERYVDLWCEAAQSSLPFTVMAHPDVIKKFACYPSIFDLEAAWERMAEAARLGNRMVEVNTSGRFNPCAEYYPAPGLLTAFCRAGVPCTVGTDAHCTAHVARDIREAYSYMEAAGYTHVAVVQRGGGLRMMRIV